MLSASLCQTQLPPPPLSQVAPLPRDSGRGIGKSQPDRIPGLLGGAGVSAQGERTEKVSPLTRSWAGLKAQPEALPEALGTFAHPFCSRRTLSVSVLGAFLVAGGRQLFLGGSSYSPGLRCEPLRPPGREGRITESMQVYASLYRLLCWGTTDSSHTRDFCMGREAGWNASRSFLVLTFNSFNCLRSRGSSKISVGLHQDSMLCESWVR